MKLTLLSLLFLPIVAGLNATVEKYVEDAVAEALEELAQASTQEVTASNVVNSQTANNDSKAVQFSAEVFQRVTIILINKYGTSILDQANDVIDAWSAEAANSTDSTDNFLFNSEEEQVKRKKRYASEPTSTCSILPRPCNDPFNMQWRQTSGACNNQANPRQGQSVTVTHKLLGTASYSDGIQQIISVSATGKALPGTRAISNALFDTKNTTVYDTNLNHFHMAYGQFIAHDTVFLPSSTATNGNALNCSLCSSGSTSSNCVPIPVPSNDSYFPGNSCIRFTRTLNGQTRLGVRMQINQNTHYLDGSTIYGSDDCEQRTVRAFVNGLMGTYTGNGYVLPPQNPAATRKIVTALHQHFVYNEYLPKILSPKYMTAFGLYPGAVGSGPFRGYDPTLDPTVTVEYAISAFRFGHSQSRNDFPRRTTNNGSSSLGAVDLGTNMFYADAAYNGSLGQTETVLMGMLTTASETADRYQCSALRNQMFEVRGQKASGVDLAAVDIMRARDAGTWPYYKYRSLVGLSSISSWSDLSSQFTAANIAALQSVYASPLDIDLYTGILMEIPVSGGKLGPTGSYIIAEQFSRLKRGDRFYYENDLDGTKAFTAHQLDAIRRTSFAKFICDNTDIASSVNSDAFNVNSTIVPCSSLTALNMSLFLQLPTNKGTTRPPRRRRGNRIGEMLNNAAGRSIRRRGSNERS